MNEVLNPIFDIMPNRERKKQPEVIEENKDSVEADNQSQTEHETMFFLPLVNFRNRGKAQKFLHKRIR